MSAGAYPASKSTIGRKQDLIADGVGNPAAITRSRGAEK
jgi:hypothetical protein